MLSLLREVFGVSRYYERVQSPLCRAGRRFLAIAVTHMGRLCSQLTLCRIERMTRDGQVVLEDWPHIVIAPAVSV